VDGETNALRAATTKAIDQRSASTRSGGARECLLGLDLTPCVHAGKALVGAALPLYGAPVIAWRDRRPEMVWLTAPAAR
jgi:hypothetical protein